MSETARLKIFHNEFVVKFVALVFSNWFARKRLKPGLESSNWQKPSRCHVCYQDGWLELSESLKIARTQTKTTNILSRDSMIFNYYGFVLDKGFQDAPRVWKLCGEKRLIMIGLGTIFCKD
jgi:hypothetical protein